MGEYKEQSRNLPWHVKDSWAQYQQRLGSEPVRRGDRVDLRPTQVTYSYRSSRVLQPADEFTPEAIREFTDVTRNGFTETNPDFDNGHSFHTTKTSSRLSHEMWRNFIVINGQRVDRWGPLAPVMKDQYGLFGKFPEVPRLSSSEISKYGAKAISVTSPTNANANLSTFLGELVEGLPRLAGRALSDPRKGSLDAIGSEYLNTMFGIKPFISDVQAICKAVSNSSKLIKQYKRDSGKLVRRRYTFPQERTHSLIEDVGHTRYVIDGYDRYYDVTDGWFYPGSNTLPKVSKHSEVLKDTWFAGAFMYHLEADDSVIGKLERFEELANHLLGTRITPSTLWELTPWSWFGDWMGTLGDVISTSSLLSSDGLVMKYGYLMRHTWQNDTYSMPAGLTFVGNRSTGPISMRLSRETKERVKATPYGFGRNPQDFSVQQWAILGALGLTKAPRILP